MPRLSLFHKSVGFWRDAIKGFTIFALRKCRMAVQAPGLYSAHGIDREDAYIFIFAEIFQ